MELKKMSNTYSLIIPVEVETKIRQICSEIWDVEWSGTLFYTYEGSFNNNDLKIICKDIFVMDIGSSTYTEFNMSPDVISYMTEHTELLDCQLALIHSHSTFNCFFSGTDIQTLKDEGATQNNFVSLIVNNKGKYTAAVTRKVTVNSVSYGFFGEDSTENNNVSTEYLEYYYLNIIKEKNTELIDRINEIRKRKEEERKEMVKNQASTVVTGEGPIRKNTVSVFPQKEYPVITKRTENNNNLSFDNGFDFDFSTPDNGKHNKSYNHSNTDIADNIEGIEFNPNLVKRALAQIISGSMLINADKFDANKWALNMCNTYTRIFGDNFTTFENWIDQICDFVISYTIDESLPDTIDQEMLLASALITELYKLPQNEYIKAIEDRLTVYFD